MIGEGRSDVMISQRDANFPAYEPVRPDPRWVLTAGGAQWRGTRTEQNDVLFISDGDPVRGLLIALADGIGLDTDAGQAARAAVDAMRNDYLYAEPMEEIHRQTLRMIGAAHAAIRTLNDSNQARGAAPVGAAAACVLIRDRKMSFSSAGNVRVFLIRAGLLLQLSRDHLLSLEAEERDILSGEAPDIDPEWAKRVTSYVGLDGLQKVDCQHLPVQMLPGDRVMVISSGLYGVLSEEELTALALCAPPQRAAEAIVEQVRSLGSASQSNVSVALAQMGL